MVITLSDYLLSKLFIGLFHFELFKMDFFTIGITCLVVFASLTIIAVIMEGFPEINFRLSVVAKKKEFRLQN